MNSIFFDIKLLEFISKKFFLIMLNTSIKSIIILFFILIFLKIFNKISSSVKHAVWFTAIVIVLIIPFQTIVSNYSNFSYSNFTLLSDLNKGIIMIPEDGYDYNSYYDSVDKTESEYKSPAKENKKNGYYFYYLIFFLWLIITALFVLRNALNYYKLAKFLKKTKTVTNKRILKIASLIKENNNLTKKIHICSSDKCKIPVSLYFLKNYVILPAEFAKWDDEKIKMVLFHELTHIKRYDCITQNVARFICSAFWFIPLIWLAYNELKLEQEKACDLNLIAKGINPFDYAEKLLGFAKIDAGHNLLLSGPFIAILRKTSLEKRIIDIINFNKNLFLRKKRSLKILFLLMIFILLFIVINPVIIKSEQEVLDNIKKYDGSNNNININNLPVSFRNEIKDYPVLWPSLFKDCEEAEYNEYYSESLKQNYYNKVQEYEEALKMIKLKKYVKFSIDYLENGIYIARDSRFPIIATADGVIESIEYEKPFRGQIVIRHKNGLRSIYTYIEYFDESILKINKKIKQGQILGYPCCGAIEKNGKDEYFYLFHYVIKSKSDCINPLNYLFNNGKLIVDSALSK